MLFLRLVNKLEYTERITGRQDFFNPKIISIAKQTYYSIASDLISKLIEYPMFNFGYRNIFTPQHPKFNICNS